MAVRGVHCEVMTQGRLEGETMKLRMLVKAGAMFAASCALAAAVAGVAAAAPAYAAVPARGGASSADLTWTEPSSAYDMTGDGVGDVIAFVTDVAHEEEGAYEGLTLKVGSASKRLLSKDAYFYYVNAVYMDLFSVDADGGAHTPVLWVSAVSDNDYQLMSAVYRVSGGKIEQLFDLQKNESAIGKRYAHSRNAGITGVKGDAITVRFSPMTYTAASVTYSYKYRYNYYAAEFARVDADNIASAKASFWDDNGKQRTYSPIVRSVKLYAKAGGKKYSTLAAGTKAKVTGVYTTSGTKLLRVKTSAGKVGFIKLQTSGKKPLFKYARMAG